MASPENAPNRTFVHASYSSPYLTFSGVELYTNIPDTSTGGYTALQTATSAQLALLRKYDAPPYVDSAAAGSIPFLDFGNEYVSIGASYSPQVLSGLNVRLQASAIPMLFRRSTPGSGAS